MSFAKAVSLMKLANMAAGRTGVCLTDVEEEFAVVRRTAQRMIAALQDAFPATEHYRGYDGRHYWRLPSRAIAHLLTPSVDELVALATACDQLQSTGLHREAQQLRTLRQKVKALVPDDKSASLATDEEALLEALGYAAKAGPQPAQNPAVNEAIAEALKGYSCLQIEYRSRSQSEPSVRTIEPLGLLLGARRYLVAIDTAKRDGRYRHYRVEDIASAKVLPAGFSPPDDFDLRAHSRQAFGSYHHPDEYGPVVWRFAPHAADWVRRYQFHPDQVVEENADGSMEIRFEASGHLEMAWHLYAWGDAVEVIEPAGLANLVHPYRRTDFAALP